MSLGDAAATRTEIALRARRGGGDRAPPSRRISKSNQSTARPDAARARATRPPPPQQTDRLPCDNRTSQNAQNASNVARNGARYDHRQCRTHDGIPLKQFKHHRPRAGTRKLPNQAPQDRRHGKSSLQILRRACEFEALESGPQNERIFSQLDIGFGGVHGPLCPEDETSCVDDAASVRNAFLSFSSSARVAEKIGGRNRNRRRNCQARTAAIAA